ncbi:hypothetical protein [Pedobacter hartonius]|uniref:Uncharacterized protein n=1 Tax=Pedobacter hartonius TaxID=425514 RepID=A0A1H4EUI8_9SPHI|nr:hypothetical protein [Pedobacter hartonius]SEA87922.1 hypothetical protein SAMN05443550_106125 [Pedobacter hartonius]
MDNKFYDLDYIIDLNTKRAEEYSSAYQRVQEQLTNIIIIYSGISIYFIPVIQDNLRQEVKNIWLYVAFGLLILVFTMSSFYTIKLILPVKAPNLDFPAKFYNNIRNIYETANPELDHDEIDSMIKTSYVSELERAVEENYAIFHRKRSFYHNALTLGLVSLIPYLICTAFHLTKDDYKIKKIEIVNLKDIINLDKKQVMARNKYVTEINVTETISAAETHLPGLEKLGDVRIILSYPRYSSENSTRFSYDKNSFVSPEERWIKMEQAIIRAFKWIFSFFRKR